MSQSGTVKSFNAKKGFGFISHEGQDVFVHLKDCDGCVPQTGDTVAFEIEESPSKPGSYKASNVSGGTGTMPDLGGGKGGGGGGGGGTGAAFGVVKSFNDSKAWGFILYEGQDVFFHLKDMVDGSAPRAGDRLQFDLEDNPQKPGSLKAKNVAGGSGWPAPQHDKGGDKGKGKGKDGGNGWAAWGTVIGGKDSWKGGGWGDDWGPYGGWGKDSGWGKGWGGDDWGKGGGWDKGGKGYGKDYGKSWKGGW